MAINLNILAIYHIPTCCTGEIEQGDAAEAERCRSSHLLRYLHADHEKKRREDEVFKMETDPGHMQELGS